MRVLPTPAVFLWEGASSAPPPRERARSRALCARFDSSADPPFAHSVNVTLGPAVSRVLITGLHTVADIYCSSCQSVLGWKYVRPSCVPRARHLAEPPPTHRGASFACGARALTFRNGANLSCGCPQEQAFEESQKYKEGKYIIEKAKMTRVGPPSFALLVHDCSPLASPHPHVARAPACLYTCGVPARRRAGEPFFTEYPAVYNRLVG